MFRKCTVLMIVAATALLAGHSAAEPPALAPGAVLNGELTPEDKARSHSYMAQFADGRTAPYNLVSVASYSLDHTVSLKAGQSLAVTATVTGKDRGVLLVLVDPTGKAVDGTELRTKTAEATFGEVSATGKYRLVVASNSIGNYTLQIKPSAERDLEIRALEQRIAWLKRDINEADAKLNALKAKKKP